MMAGCAHVDVSEAGPAGQTLLAAGWVVAPQVAILEQQQESDCGPTALTMLLRHWRTASEPPIERAHLPAPAGRGVSAGQLRNEARRRGFASYVFPGTFADLATELQAGRPVLVGIEHEVEGRPYGHYVVVAGHDLRQQQWLVADPAAGWRLVSRAELERQWSAAGFITLVAYRNELAAL